jgi:restriction system protein
MGYARGPEPLFGRETELRELESFFRARLRDGKRAGAHIYGPRGMGKTALVKHFVERNRHLFPAGAMHFPPQLHADPEAPEAFLEDVALVRNLDPLGPGLVIMDDADLIRPGQLNRILIEVWRQRQEASVILVSHTDLVIPSDPGMPRDWFGLNLDSLPTDAMRELLALKVDLSDVDTFRLIESVQGNPRLAKEVLFQLARKSEGLDQLLARLAPNTYSGLLDRDGRPLAPESEVAEPVRIQLRAVSAELVERIKARPSLIHELSPRQFEEFVAGLYERHGFEVKLTPASKDGGFDLYAIRHEAFGRFLTIVECKQNAPNRPVGVELVRSLYGVLAHKEASFGVIATTSTFTAGAKELQREHEYRLGLQDWLALQNMLRGPSSSAL